MTTAAAYFDELRSRAQRAGEPEFVWIRVRGYVVRLGFYGLAPTKAMLINLGYLLTDPQETADETVWIWEDSLDELMAASMIPQGARHIHYHQTDEWHVLFPGVVSRLAARDNVARQTFVCFERGTAFPEAYVNKPFVNELQWWLWDNYLLLHGAVVGSGGRGAFITAPSGKGKSTLALAGLVQGMDYVSEDYVLVGREGRAVGYPLLSTAYLTTRTLEMLPQLRAGALLYVDWRDKYLVDLTAFGDRFVDELPLDAMIYPVVCNASEPTVVPTKRLEPFIAALTTTAKQIKSQERFADSFKVLFRRMKSIPAYEMRLTNNPLQNAAALRAFLEGLEA